VCAGARRALPAPPAAAEEEVEMVSQRTVAEVVQERWQWAEARGLVVDAEEEVSPEELRRWREVRREADAVSRPVKRQRGASTASSASSAAGPSSAANGARSPGADGQLEGAAAAVKQEAGDRAAAAAAAELRTSEGAAKHESKRALWKPPPSALVVDLTDD